MLYVSHIVHCSDNMPYHVVSTPDCNKYCTSIIQHIALFLLKTESCHDTNFVITVVMTTISRAITSTLGFTLEIQLCILYIIFAKWLFLPTDHHRIPGLVCPFAISGSLCSHTNERCIRFLSKSTEKRSIKWSPDCFYANKCLVDTNS